MNLKTSLLILVACAIPTPSAIADMPAPDSTPSVNSSGVSPDIASRWLVDPRLYADSFGSREMFRACLNKTGNTWSLADRCNLMQDGFEQLVLDLKNNVIYLGAFSPTANNSPAFQQSRSTGSNQRAWECFYGVNGTAKRDKYGYNVCSSAFSKSASTASNIVGIIGLAFGKSRTQVEIDTPAILAAATQSGTLTEAERQQHALYRDRLTSSATVASLDSWIKRYQTNDPDNLIPAAKQRLAAMQEYEEQQRRAKELEEERQKLAAVQEAAMERYRFAFKDAHSSSDWATFISTYRDNDPDKLIPQAKKAYARALSEEKTEQARQEAELSHFRTSLKITSETNCGPVLEFKKPLVKIYSPVRDYGNEHWIRISDLYPPGYGCRFFNGQYQPPQ